LALDCDGFRCGEKFCLRLFLLFRLLRLELLEDDDLLDEDDLELRRDLEDPLLERLRDLSRSCRLSVLLSCLLTGVRLFGRSLGLLLLLLLRARECLLRDRALCLDLDLEASRSGDSDSSEAKNLPGAFIPKHRKSLLP